MSCFLYASPKTCKPENTSKGCQHYSKPASQKTFTGNVDTLFSRRQVSADRALNILQAHPEISRLTELSVALPSVLSVVKQK
ncbi:hypothetical protein [Microcoleus sp. FACHB-672]|uniref:hypothetical protein n=1 Tax=Microcoleus sp. FACHB-672 TaxID=2692825 RepID=UPI00168700DA|nr:hypothetical protein [Microcoleus sp. FACHB-672]MBD2041910.1 hypothetical protein [Microcoleus sp. FACHB-672]